LSRRSLVSALQAVEAGFRQLETLVPPPGRVRWKDGFVFRYQEKTIQQAIIQKLARTVSGLYALNALLDLGLFQEQGVIQRTLDEIGEDITFLSLAVIENDVTERHKKYLEYFYQEEFSDPADIAGSHVSRPSVPREKIRAYINQSSGSDLARANIMTKIIAKAYSGFVHAASPNVMDMCVGNPPTFDVNGATRMRRREEHERDAKNYFYRALVAVTHAAKALGDESLCATLAKHASAFYDEMYSQ